MTRRPFLAPILRLRPWILLVASLLALTLPRPALADIINVAAGDVPGFIAAIITANASAGDDTINLGGGTYLFTAANNDANALPVINNANTITINGNGSTLARSGAQAFRFFQVTAGNLTLNSLTLTGGNPGASNDGGAVLDSSTGTLTVTSSTFSGNTAQQGGAIFKSGSGNVTVTGSTFTNNTATSGTSDAEGGAIYSDSTGNVTVTDSTFTNNRATSSGTFGDAAGGAIKIDGDTGGSGAGNLTVTGSTFTINTATSSGTGDADGGAIDADGNSNVTVTDSTFTNNRATSSGAPTEDGASGGAIKIENSGTLTITGSTFVSNTATSSAADASRGGALLVDESSTSAVNNNCFVGNTAQSGGGVFKGSPPDVNAEDNWWGAVNGPSEAGPGSGDGVSTNVDFDPFLTSAPFAGCNALTIPTLSEWAQLGMVALLIVGGLLALRRRARLV